jgi:hypothetical protein
MRDGHVSVAEISAYPSLSLLRALKREFGFYSVKLVDKQPVEPKQPEMIFVVGGNVAGFTLSSMELYDCSLSQ